MTASERRVSLFFWGLLTLLLLVVLATAVLRLVDEFHDQTVYVYYCDDFGCETEVDA